VEVDLPNADDRARFVEDFLRRNPGVSIDGGAKGFVEDTAGLKLTNVQDLLESTLSTGEAVTRKLVLAEVNAVLSAELGDIIRVNIPDHGPDDVIGSEETRAIFES